MASTFTVPLTSLPPGTYHFPNAGGSPIADGDTFIDLNIDRTVAGGLNALTAAATIQINVYQSDDGGNIFYSLAGGGLTGGLYPNPKTGGNFTNSIVRTFLNPTGSGRVARAEIIVAGATIAVAGVLTTG